MYNYEALNEYQTNHIQGKVAASSPHGLVAMLLQGILDKLAKAKGAIARNDIALRGQEISATIRIIDNLRASLDLKNGGNIANSLHALYDYMERRLVQANASADPRILNEVARLIEEIKVGWDTIAKEAGK